RWSPCRPVRRDSWPSHDRDVTSSSRALATMASTSAGHAHVIEKSFSRSEAPLSSLGAVNRTFRGDMPMSQATSMRRAAAVLVFALIVVLQVARAACADSIHIPAKIEGMAFGPDVIFHGVPMHRLYIANDNDFLAAVADKNNVTVDNPNPWFVFAFTDTDLPGFVQQPFTNGRFD